MVLDSPLHLPSPLNKSYWKHPPNAVLFILHSMAHEKHSESLSTPSRGCRSRSVRHFGGHKRLTVAEVAAVVLMHAPGKMLRTSEIAAGAQKMFVPRYDDPKELSKFR